MAATYIAYLVYSGLAIIFSFAVGYGFKQLQEAGLINAPSTIIAGIGMGLIVLGFVAYIDIILRKLQEYIEQKKIKRYLTTRRRELLGRAGY